MTSFGQYPRGWVGACECLHSPSGNPVSAPAWYVLSWVGLLKQSPSRGTIRSAPLMVKW